MQEQDYISLIIKKLNHEISISESKTLLDWIQADKTNEKRFLEIKEDWENTANYKSDIKPDLKLAWETIESKLSPEIETPIVSIAKNNKWLKIAATVVILLGMSFFAKDFLSSGGLITEKTAENETKSIILPDGSNITLNENSFLSYQKDFNTRNVNLKGEAFFDIVKDSEKPFTVYSRNTTTQVLGTSFNIDAYSKEKIEVALLSGKVKFSNTTNNSIILNPGETAIYNIDSEIFSIEKSSNSNQTSWKTKNLIFDETRIEKVIEDLEDYFHVDIELNSKNNSCKFTGKFEDAELIEVLEVVSYSLNTEYKYSNDIYLLENISCE